MTDESLPSGVLKVAEDCKRLLINFAESVWQAGKDGFRCDSIAYVREERAAVESAIDQLAALASPPPQATGAQPHPEPSEEASSLPVEPFGYVSMTAVRQGRQGSFLGTFVETHDSVPIYRGEALYSLRRTVDQLRAERDKWYQEAAAQAASAIAAHDALEAFRAAATMAQTKETP